MKQLGYYIFAIFFHIFRLCPVKQNKIYFIATHDNSPEGNIGVVRTAIQKRNKKYRMVTMSRKDGIRHPFHFFVTLSFHMATAGLIFEDNVFVPMAYLHFSKKTRIVQMWHGTGTIKKFGQDANTGRLYQQEQRGNRHTTHLIVNSEYSKHQSAGAFGVPENIVYVTGMPRTDFLFHENEVNKMKQDFYEKYSALRNKRIILYAPTFRDEEINHPSVALNLLEMEQSLSEDEVLLLRLHPFVAKALNQETFPTDLKRILNVCEYPQVMTLLAVADVLVTDYSSIIFEYCVFQKPMIFYAYDLEQFEADGRSFYESYEEYVPGVVVKNQNELVTALHTLSKEPNRIQEFMKQSYAFTDGESTERLLQLLDL